MKKLEWDSQFFGMPIYNYSDVDDANTILPKNKCVVQTKVCIDDTSRIAHLENRGFNFVELEVLYTKKLCRTNITKRTSEYDPKYLKELILMTEKTFLFSRYEVFGIEKVKRFYSKWLINSTTSEFDDGLLLYIENDIVMGYITYKILDKINARVGLLCVDPDYQSKGIGSILLRDLEAFLYNSGVITLNIATQGRNKQANNFYIKNGYKIDEISSFYYLKVKDDR